MKRREFICLVSGAAAWPLAARAQQAGVPIVGYLGSGSPDDQVNLVDATLGGLKEAGYADGQNIRIEYRWSEGHYDRLPALAEELVKRPVALIIAAGGSDPGRAAKAATSTIPIVFITAADPVKAGLVAGLNRPQGNITGISMIGSVLEAKRLELIHGDAAAGVHDRRSDQSRLPGGEITGAGGGGSDRPARGEDGGAERQHRGRD